MNSRSLTKLLFRILQNSRKKGDKSDIKNYRPVTVLDSVGKVFERLITKQIVQQYDPVLSPYSTAYRKSHSCETTFIRLIEDWRLSLAQKLCLGILSTDMSKAFGSLQQTLMLRILAYGFKNKAKNILRSYFQDRMNRVRLSSVVSEWKSVDRGCPQGSSLCPLVWNLYQNDLAHFFKNSDFLMHADDHQVYVSDHSIEYVQGKLNTNGEIAYQ